MIIWVTNPPIYLEKRLQCFQNENLTHLEFCQLKGDTSYIGVEFKDKTLYTVFMSWLKESFPNSQFRFHIDESGCLYY